MLKMLKPMFHLMYYLQIGQKKTPCIASLEIRTIGLWTVGPFDYNLIQMDDCPADSCTISPPAFLFIVVPASWTGNREHSVE